MLSGGSIANPQLLMLSGVGPAGHLREMGIPVVHDLPGVGRNFSDHPLIFIDASVQDHIPLDGLAPRLQVGLRYTATGSERPNDMMMWMQSFASERINRGGNRMEATGIRITGSIYLASEQGQDYADIARPPRAAVPRLPSAGRSRRTGGACARWCGLRWMFSLIRISRR